MFFCKILYIILILALLVVAILFTYYSAYLALILALVIPAVFLVILIVNRFCIKYNSYVDTVSVVKGDRIKFNFELINKGPFPSGNIRTYLELYYGDEKRINKVIDTDIMPFSSRKRTLEITAEYTGDLKIVRKKVLLLDYFKLFSFKLSKNNKVFKIFVMPKAFPLDIDYRVAVGNELVEADKYSPHKKGNDKTEIFNVREYVPGDQIKDIHWKLTSKLDKYMVKEYSLPIHIGIDILVDFTKYCKKLEGIKIQDKLMEVFYSVSSNLAINEVGFNIMMINKTSNSFCKDCVTKEEELFTMMGMVIEAFSSNEQTGVMDEDVLLNGAKSDNIIYITAGISDKLIELLSSFSIEKRILFIFVTDANNKNLLNEKIQLLPEGSRYVIIDANTEGMGNVHEIKL